MTAQPEDPDRLVRMAQGWLRQKEFTRFEVRAALLRAGGHAGDIDRVLDRLTEQSLLDDYRTGWRYVLRRSARLRGPDVICRELQERGVAPELARKLVGRIPDEEWQRYALRVWERYFGEGGGRRRSPLHGPATMLRMRGFRAEHIEAVLSIAAL